MSNNKITINLEDYVDGWYHTDELSPHGLTVRKFIHYIIRYKLRVLGDDNYEFKAEDIEFSDELVEFMSEIFFDNYSMYAMDPVRHTSNDKISNLAFNDKKVKMFDELEYQIIGPIVSRALNTIFRAPVNRHFKVLQSDIKGLIYLKINIVTRMLGYQFSKLNSTMISLNNSGDLSTTNIQNVKTIKILTLRRFIYDIHKSTRFDIPKSFNSKYANEYINIYNSIEIYENLKESLDKYLFDIEIEGLDKLNHDKFTWSSFEYPLKKELSPFNESLVVSTRFSNPSSGMDRAVNLYQEYKWYEIMDIPTLTKTNTDKIMNYVEAVHEATMTKGRIKRNVLAEFYNSNSMEIHLNNQDDPIYHKIFNTSILNTELLKESNAYNIFSTKDRHYMYNLIDVPKNEEISRMIDIKYVDNALSNMSK